MNFNLMIFKNLSKESKATFWYAVSNILIKGIALITVPVFTRILSESDYGLVSVYAGWREIFFVFGTLNLFYAVYNNALLKYEKEIDNYTSSMVFLIFIMSGIYFVIYLLNIEFWNKVLDLSFVTVMTIFIELITVSSYNFWLAKQRFQFKYHNVVILTMMIAILSPLLSWIFILYFDNKVYAKIIGTALPGIVIGIVLSINFLKKGKKYIDKEYWKYALCFNIPLIPHYLSGIILNQSDRIMISRLVSDSKAGIYSVAYSAAFTLTVITTAVNNALIPWMYNRMEQKEYDSIRKRTRYILFYFSIMEFLFILIIPEVIFILAPPSYREAVHILPALVLSVFFQFLYGFFGTIELYFEKSLYVMLASVIASLVNIILNFVFIPKYGYYVAGYTTLFCFIIMSITHYIFLNLVLQKMKIFENLFDYRAMISISLVLLCVGFAVSFLYQYISIRYVIAVFILLLTIYNLKREKGKQK